MAYVPVMQSAGEFEPLISDRSEIADTNSIANAEPSNVLQWLQVVEKHNFFWILKELERARPADWLEFEEQKNKARPRLKKRTSCDDLGLVGVFSTDTLASQRKKAAIHPRQAGDPFIQFCTPVFYGLEEEPFISLDVMRIGCVDAMSEVMFETEDDSAHAGIKGQQGAHYEAKSGTLTFQPGDTVQTLDVKLIDNVTWSTTLEFKVKLKDEGLKGAILARRLREARVKIINDDPFPTAKFGTLSSDAAMDSVPRGQLFWEYCKMNMDNPIVRCGTIKTLLIDSCHNIWYLVHLFMNVYLLDSLVDVSVHPDKLFVVHDRTISLVIFAGIHIAASAAMHWLDYERLNTKVGGTSRAFLQRAIVRKFLNFSNDVRHHIKDATVITAVTRDAPAMVSEGYSDILGIAKAAGQLLCMLGFKLSAPYVFGKVFDPIACLPLVVFPVVFAFYLPLREGAIRRALNERHKASNVVLDQLTVMTQNVNLVLDYSLRNEVTNKFETDLRLSNKAGKKASQTLLNTEYFAHWVTTVVVVAYIYYGATRVVHGQLAVGMYVTNIKIFEACGQAFGDIFGIIVRVQAMFPSLENVVKLINGSSDVTMRHAERAKNNAKSVTLRKACNEQLKGSADDVCGEDAMPISFVAPQGFKLVSIGEPSRLNFSGGVVVSQGLLIAITGGVGSGKTTLLRLLASRLFPAIDSSGVEVFVPAHLRIVNVQDDALFYLGTLLENLTLGTKEPKDRVIKVCRRLGISESVLSYLDSELPWSDIFSGAECKLLMIARALVNNPELICFHKPLAKLDSNRRPVVMNTLHDHVQNKGLDMAMDPKYRRPRTVLVSASQPEQVEKAQEIYNISLEHGIAHEHCE